MLSVSSTPQNGDYLISQVNRIEMVEQKTTKQVTNDDHKQRASYYSNSNIMNKRLLLMKLIPQLVETFYNLLANNWLSIKRHKQALSYASRQTTFTCPHKRPSLIVSIILPLLFVFLLPTFKLDHPNEQNRRLLESTDVDDRHEALISQEVYLQLAATSPRQARKRWPSLNELILPLIRFPFDRLRLVSSGLGCVSARETPIQHGQSDLQEEETNMQMLPPAEHRSAYLASGNPQQVQTNSAGYQQAPGRTPQRLLEQMSHSNGYQPSTGASGAEVVHSISADQSAPGEYALDGGAGEQSGPIEAGTASISESPTSVSGNGFQQRSDLPAVRALNVKCEKNHMMVNLVFDRPFYGMVFSKGHYNDQKCIHLPPSSGQTSVNFDIHLGRCGMTSSDASGNPHAMALHQSGANNAIGQQQQQQQQPHGLYIENTIIIQYDPQVQEIYDQARKLRCTWYDYYEKSVSFKPYNVDMLDAVTANFLGDNIQCWMQIQVGKGPWSSEVAGIVKIGQTMTMVLAIKDDENRFDMLVRNCVAHDGKHQPIQLVDEFGCVARPKIMTRFQKVKNFGPAATVVSYAQFQAFKFPDSMSVHFQCVIQVCRSECPEPVCSGSGSGQPGLAISGESGGGQPAGDYTASGTEIVASKEPLTNNYFLAANHSALPGSAVNLKLDEAQGRVQVKLDTSMMAGVGQQRPNGPYPPHLLHLAAGSSGAESRPVGGIAAPSGRAAHSFLSSSYQNKPATGHQAASTSGAATSSSRPPQAGYGARPAQVTPSSHPALHYSSPYQHRSTVFATNRLGEQAPVSQEFKSSPEPELPLSLIATPRALQNAIQLSTSWPTAQLVPKAPASNHRYRRSLALNATQLGQIQSASTTNRIKAQDRKERDARQESTAVKTHKTIQVVSPDDVAFSLLSDDLELDPLTVVTGTPSRRQLHSATGAGQPLSTVCFSAAKLVFAVLVTLAALAAGIVIVAFVIMRQRSKLEAANLSNVYENTGDQVGSSLSLLSSESAALQQPLRLDGRPDLVLHRQAVVDYSSQQQKQIVKQQKQHRQYCSPTTERRHDDELMARRQDEEIQQRNKCLARLYSQFVPAAYWR